MLSIAQAAQTRGDAGLPLPGMWAALAARQAQVKRGQVTFVFGPPGAGKSLLIMNYIARARVPTLAFMLDMDQLSAAARFASILTGDPFARTEKEIDSYLPHLATLEDVQLVFSADDVDSMKLHVEAFEQRYGAYPSLIVLDNIGNVTSSYADEWQLVKAVTLELNSLALKWQCAVIVAHHASDSTSSEPLPRTAMLGRASQYQRLILSVGFNAQSQAYKVAIVKNSGGPSDPAAVDPVTLWADPSRMAIMEADPNWRPWGRSGDGWE